MKTISIPQPDGTVQVIEETVLNVENYSKLHDMHGSDTHLSIVMMSHLSDVQTEVCFAGMEETITTRCNFVKWLINRYEDYPIGGLRIFPDFEFKMFKQKI